LKSVKAGWRSVSWCELNEAASVALFLNQSPCVLAVAVAFTKIIIVRASVAVFEFEIPYRCWVLIVEDPRPNWSDERL
jgi:hypothetical protein